MMVPLSQPADSTAPSGHFDLANVAAYRAWRAQKLSAYPRDCDALPVTVADAFKLTEDEREAILQRLGKTNLAIYRLPAAAAADKRLVRELGRQFGLENLDNNLCADEDGITSLRVVGKRRVGEYIPYTNKRLNWHTDGYYNGADRQIRGVILHCVRPAVSGGENAFMDHEIAYIKLRDENPDYIRALMAADAMTIPPNVQGGRELRPAQTGPVFSIDAEGYLHMRYSARGRNIVWKNDPGTRAAAEYLLTLFQQDSPYIFRHRLEAGEGVISNNALHCRTQFSHDGDSGRGRLLYRARYFDRAGDIAAGG